MSREDAGPSGEAVLRARDVDAVIFDLDGVLTDTAGAHFRAWKETFDSFLERRAEREGIPFRPFTRGDYLREVDGKPRYRGAEDFLRSRGIELPRGDPQDPPGRDTVCALGNRKNRAYRARLAEEGPETYGPAVELVRRLREAGVKTGVVTSSRNGRAVLGAAGIAGLFDAVADGTDLAEEDSLAGKPAPDLFLEVARRLGADRQRSVVVEDAAAGVEAGVRGGFRLVVGVAREGDPEALESAGADLVVPDLTGLSVSPPPGGRRDRERAAGSPAPGDAGCGGGR